MKIELVTGDRAISTDADQHVVISNDAIETYIPHDSDVRVVLVRHGADSGAQHTAHMEAKGVISGPCISTTEKNVGFPIHKKELINAYVNLTTMKSWLGGGSEPCLYYMCTTPPTRGTR